jgi:hypothetical protein
MQYDNNEYRKVGRTEAPGAELSFFHQALP